MEFSNSSQDKIEDFERRSEYSALDACRKVLSTPEGAELFKYLFKHFQVAELDNFMVEDSLMREALGFRKAGNSLYSLACKAYPEAATKILTEKEKERLHVQRLIENANDVDG